MAVTGWSDADPIRAIGRARRPRMHLLLSAAAAFGLVASACSSGSSVDASALPKPDAPEIGRAVNAALMGPTSDLTSFDDTNGHGGMPPGGRYQIGVRNQQSLVTSVLDDDFPVDQIITASFDASAGAIDAGFGVICRQEDDDNYYRLGVGNDGTYAIQRVQDGKTTVLTGAGQWVRGPTIRNTPGIFNVRVECVGDTLTLFESNQPVAAVRDDTIKGNKVGVFVETFREPSATIQMDSLSVRAFRDRSRVTDVVADGWDDLLRTQSISNRCSLLDPKRASAGAGTSFVTRCGSVLLLKTETPQQGARGFDRILQQSGSSLETVKSLPQCSKRTGVRGPLPPPTPPPGVTDNRASVGSVACLDLGDSTAVLWVHDLAGVVGITRVKDGDRAAWKDYGPDWPPFSYVEQPA
jgi:hypothetical protein